MCSININCQGGLRPYIRSYLIRNDEAEKKENKNPSRSRNQESNKVDMEKEYCILHTAYIVRCHYWTSGSCVAGCYCFVHSVSHFLSFRWRGEKTNQHWQTVHWISPLIWRFQSQSRTVRKITADRKFRKLKSTKMRIYSRIKWETITWNLGILRLQQTIAFSAANTNHQTETETNEDEKGTKSSSSKRLKNKNKISWWRKTMNAYASDGTTA